MITREKTIACILALMMCLSTLTACGSGDTPAAQEQQSDQPVQETEETVSEEGSEETEKAEACYEEGRAFLYGFDGKEINLQSAHEKFEEARELGKVEANFYLGVLCDDYNYPAQDYAAAKSYYEACGDYPYAQIALAILYYNGRGAEEDKTLAEEMFQSVVDGGCVEGYFGLGYAAHYAKDYEAALECFNRALEGTEPLYLGKAMNTLGYEYMFGNGVGQDYAKALEWYEKAAELGSSAATNNIGAMYRDGLGVTQDYTKALEWWEKAAALGSSGAMDSLGDAYFNGDGVVHNYTKALEWYEKAAALGHTGAMHSIGAAYYDGNGVPQDYAKALEWWEKAAALGNVTAMRMAGVAYYEGRGAAQDYAKALEWWEKAAALGNAGSMNNIGHAYHNGNGVPQDYVKALEWYEKAAALGDSQAAENAEQVRALINQ